jgi:translation initiation factor IF-3
MHGNIALNGAMQLAQEYELDLVEVDAGSNGNLPVCKLIDYSKYKYKEEKMNKKNKRQGVQVLKEIHFKYKTDKHDLQVKHKKIMEFLGKRYKVRYVLVLSGRELDKQEEARRIFLTNLETFRNLATWDEVVFADKALSTIINPL